MMSPRRHFRWVVILFPGLSAAWHTAKNPTIPRIPEKDFSIDRFYGSDHVRPVIVSGALDKSECERCCNIFLDQPLLVDVQHQHSNATEIFETTLDDAIEILLYESNSHDAYMTFCEGLLDAVGASSSLRSVATVASEVREAGFANDPNWFDEYFPKHLRPSDAVIFTGAGATSTLHRDPFEWLGTSLCLEGTKVWRFLAPKVPIHKVDDALKSYRLDSNAWENGVALSAGWQSDFSLFRSRQHDNIPSAQTLSEMDDSEEKREYMQRLASDLDIFRPDDITDDLEITTIIQEEGDMILIPAHWWHQTYALEPSVSIASQRCGSREGNQVLLHMLERLNLQADTVGLPDCLAKPNVPVVDPQRAIDRILSSMLSLEN